LTVADVKPIAQALNLAASWGEENELLHKELHRLKVAKLKPLSTFVFRLTRSGSSWV
jgi:hypothetical protein